MWRIGDGDGCKVGRSLRAVVGTMISPTIRCFFQDSRSGFLDLQQENPVVFFITATIGLR